MHFQDFLAQNKTSEISKIALSGILGLLGAEQDVGNLKKCTFRNSGTSVRRTRRQKSQQNARSGILGLLGAEQDVGNLKNALSGILDSRKQNKTSEISKHEPILAHIWNTFGTHRTNLEHIWNAWRTLRHV